MVRRSSTESFERIAHLTPRLRLHQADLLDPSSLVALLQAVRPAELYNLAAQSFVPTSWAQPSLTGRVHRARRDAHARGGAPGRPAHPLLPGVEQRDVRQGARDAAERGHALLPAQPLRRRQGLRAPHHRELPRELRALRGLGHPVQPRVAAPRARVRDAADQRGRRSHQARARGPSCGLGNLDARRDWGFAPEYVRAMWRMLQQPEPGDFVVGNGHPPHAARVRGAWPSRTSGSTRPTSCASTRALLRPAEVDTLLADPSKARRELGWQAETAFAELVRIMLEADLAAQERASGRRRGGPGRDERLAQGARHGRGGLHRQPPGRRACWPAAGGVRLLDDFSSGRAANVAHLKAAPSCCAAICATAACSPRALAGVEVVFHQARGALGAAQRGRARAHQRRERDRHARRARGLAPGGRAARGLRLLVVGLWRHARAAQGRDACRPVRSRPTRSRSTPASATASSITGSTGSRRWRCATSTSTGRARTRRASTPP